MIIALKFIKRTPETNEISTEFITFRWIFNAFEAVSLTLLPGIKKNYVQIILVHSVIIFWDFQIENKFKLLGMAFHVFKF